MSHTETIEVLDFFFNRFSEKGITIMDAIRNYHNAPDQTDHPLAIRRRRRPLQWLDLRVFYIRLDIHSVVNYGSTPESLTLYHVPLEPDTLLEVNGVRAPLHSDGIPNLLKRDRVDKKTEEVTFVSTDSVRTTGSLRFEVFDGPMLVLSGDLEMGRGRGPVWAMSCEPGGGIFEGFLNRAAPAVEVYAAGSFSGSPIALCKNMVLGLGRKKQVMRRGNLECIPEYEVGKGDDGSSARTLSMRDYMSLYKAEEEGIKYIGGDEDEELSRFNAGVRVGVGIGLGLCLGVGIGVGLLVQTYKGTTTKFARRCLM